MEKLTEIKNGYMDLFNRTGKIEFFMRAKGLEKLERNIALVEELSHEDGLNLANREDELTL